MEWQEQRQKPHVAIFPGFGSGHHIPLLQLAKQLTVYHGFSVIFFTAKWMGASPHQTPPSSSGGMIRFIELPDVQIEGDHDAGTSFLVRIPLLLEKANILVEDALTSFPFPVCAFIIDVFGIPMLDVASKLEIPSYIFFPSAASILCITLYSPTLAHSIEICFKDVDFPIEVPGLPPILGIDLPSPLQDRSDIFNWFIQRSLRLHEACGILINSCQEIEPEQVKALKEGKVLSVPEKQPSIYAVGPLISSSLSESDDNYEREGCLKWLDRQPASSVLFVSFGSRGTLSENQIRELALGLEASGQRFLWVLRREPPPPTESTMTAGAEMRDVLPEGFETRTEDRGFVVDSWAPQIAVLSHPSTGGFLSHCGWNSTIESILHGVPMIAWPLFAEQKTNAFFLVKQMKVATEAKKGADGLVKREEVERAAREVMEGDGGMEMKKRMEELMGKARDAVAEGGSSYNALAAVASVWKEMHATNKHSTTSEISHTQE